MADESAEGQRLDREPAEGLEVKCSREEQGSMATQLTYELPDGVTDALPTEAFLGGLEEELKVTVACTPDGERSFRVLVLRGEEDDSAVDTVDGCIRLALKAKLGDRARFEDQDPQAAPA